MKTIIRSIKTGIIVLWLISPSCLNAQFIKLFDFTQISGREPYGSLVLDEGSQILYGLTYNGGDFDHGTLFKYDLGGSEFSKMIDFNMLTGADPRGSLLKVGSTLFGMTSDGGANGDGTIFKILTDGTNYTTIYDFDLAMTGGTPFGSLIISGDLLYGMAYDGGPNDLGVIFRIDTNGNNYTVLHGFGGDDGNGPYGEVILDGNTLYGMTKYGGTGNFGVIFRIQSDGSGYTKLFDFDFLNSGGYPDGSLTLYENMLYGMAAQGGDHGAGTIFRKTTTGSGFTKLMDFQGSITGEYPWGNLVVYNDHFYGMADGNGTLHYGCIFSIALDGSAFTAVYEFSNSLNGSQPRGTPVLVPITGGILYYAMMQTGGKNDDGVIFSYYDPETGIDPVNSRHAVSVYPVPASDILFIRSVKPVRSVNVFDLLGRQIYQGTFDSRELHINVAGLENGIYFARIEGEQFTVTRKFLKE